MLKRIKIALTLLAGLIIWFAYLAKAKTIELHAPDNRITLSEALPGDWDHVCVLSPYSTSPMAKEVTGIRINVELQSSISMSDSISALITMKGGRVKDLYEVARDSVDFSSLGGKCYTRNDSTFTKPVEGHPHAAPVR